MPDDVDLDLDEVLVVFQIVSGGLSLVSNDSRERWSIEIPVAGVCDFLAEPASIGRATECRVDTCR